MSKAQLYIDVFTPHLEWSTLLRPPFMVNVAETILYGPPPKKVILSADSRPLDHHAPANLRELGIENIVLSSQPSTANKEFCNDLNSAQVTSA